tara:strand:+ start:3066 stop:4040 length:975 start_codon:yes stop_codon:yes gene_type:complete
MLVLKDLSAEVPDTNAYHWRLEEYSEDDSTSALLYGYHSYKNKENHRAMEEHTRKIMFNNWMPCEFAQYSDSGFDALHYDEMFSEVYTICPHSAKWLNDIRGDEKYKTIFYPFHEDLVPEPQKKIYDVIYHGGIHGNEHVECLETISQFKYQYITMTRHINELTMRCLGYATTGNLPFKDKIGVIAKSKISVCYNMVHNQPLHTESIKKYPNWGGNVAFSEVDAWDIMPQFKTRMHEAAMSRTLNLVQRDPWNMAEYYYQPETEFIYFDDKNDLKDKIHEISTNWHQYEAIVERAFKRSLDYTVRKFIAFIESGHEWKGVSNEL